jgi:hypothetical protein
MEEIIYNKGINYYLDNSNEIIQCDSTCEKCYGTSTDCLKCANNLYFAEGHGKTCYSIAQISDLTDSKYYLPKGSDTYYKCDSNCVCEKKKDYCTACTNSYYFIEDSNKCTNDASIVGYYLQSSTYKKCDDTCLTCDGAGPNKCLSCSPPYYLINIDNDKRCITKFEKNKLSIYDNYYFNTNDNEFKSCDISCLTCNDGTDGKQCIKCSENYYFYEDGGESCLTKTEFFDVAGQTHYYFNEYLQEFRKCHSYCKSCRDGNIYNQCYECENGYAFIDDENSGNCVLESLFTTTLTNYYKEEINNHQIRSGTSTTTTTVFVYKKCPENCETCSSKEENPLQCLTCNQDKGYYKQYDAPAFNLTQEQCEKNNIKKHRYYNGNGYSPSSNKCLTSTYETEQQEKCLSCHNKLGYYSLDRSEETCDNIIPEDHYLTLNYIIKKCAYECASCSEGPTATSTNCDVCKEDYPPSLINPKNCLFNCSYYMYEYMGNKYCTGEKECPEERSTFLIKENATCVEECERVSYYGICLNECPAKTRTTSGKECNDIPNTCVLSEFEEIREHLVDLKNDKGPVTKKVKKYKKYFSNTYYHVDIYKHYLNEYIMIIYQNNDCVKELLPDLISIDFSLCNIYKNQNIIVLFLIPREGKYEQVFYQIYNIDNDLSLTITPLTSFSCSKVYLEIPAKKANFDIEKYETFINKDIDLTNSAENFFHDMCFQNYEDGKDIVINQRRKEYFQDPYKICIDNCNFKSPDFIYKRAKCECKSTYHSLDKLNEEEYDNNVNRIINENFYNTDVYVFEHLKCFLHNFEEGNIFKNMGSYFIIVFFICQIISTIVYAIYGIDIIKLHIIDFIKRNPPKKIKVSVGSEEELNEDEQKSELENKNIKNISDEKSEKNTSMNFIEEKSSKKNKKSIINNFVHKDNKAKKKSTKKSWEKPDLIVGRSNNFGRNNFDMREKGVRLYQKNMSNLFQNELKKGENNKDDNNNKNKSMLFFSKHNIKNSVINENFKKHNHVFTDYELNSMELYDAEIKDKRSFCYFYKLQMKAKQEFYRAFCFFEPLYPISLKIIIYIYNLSLNLSFNALLYTEDQIYEGIKSIGKSAGNIFLRAFYTFLIVKGIDYLIHLLIKNSNYLRSLVLRRRREKELRIDSYKSIKNVRLTFGLFIFIVFICDILFWIYLSSFCYCYHGEQLELFLGFLVTQFYMEIYCVLFGLYLAVFRYLGLKYKATTCYKISQTFLDN